MRQNIDEEWKTDPRRRALVKRLGSERLADGMRVEINWLILDHKGEPIPLKKFKFVDDYEVWIDCGLAEVQSGLVFIAGTNRYKEFFEKQKENGKKGGRPLKPDETQNNPTKPNKSETKPENPSYSSSISSSSSSSSSDFENSSNSKPQALIAGYCSRFKIRYGENPEILGKDAGIAKRLVKGWSQAKIDLYLDAFFAMPDSWLVKTKHPLAAFETKLNEVVVFAKSGEFTTMKQAQQADVAVTISDQLKRLGEVKK